MGLVGLLDLEVPLVVDLDRLLGLSESPASCPSLVSVRLLLRVSLGIGVVLLSTTSSSAAFRVNIAGNGSRVPRPLLNALIYPPAACLRPRTRSFIFCGGRAAVV